MTTGTRVERGLAAGLSLLGIVLAALAGRLPGPTGADPVGPRGFPSLLGVVLLVCGLALGLSRRGFRAPAGDPGAGAAAASPDGPGPLAVGRLVGGLGLTAAYLGVLEPLGYLLASPAYLAALLLAQGGVPLRTLLLTALGLPGALYLLFAVVMRVPLPPGLLEAWLRGGAP